MKILCTGPVPWRRELGAPKITIELAEALRGRGHQVDLLDPPEIPEVVRDFRGRTEFFSRWLLAELKKKAAGYDVVEVEHHTLPFEREQVGFSGLLVARASLLCLHIPRTHIPGALSWKQRLLRLVGMSSEVARWRDAERRAMATMRAADLVNVANAWDKRLLVELGFSPDRVVVVPYGLTDVALADLGRLSPRQEDQRVVFVGTFDCRKGSEDFPRLVRRVRESCPEARFRLVGTDGRFHGEAEVKRSFDLRDREAVEVVPRFAADELAGHLQGCSVGVFPSYVESFGFGVVEMMAAGLPVVAYDAPGPCDILPPNCLVPRGDCEALARCVIGWLKNREDWQREAQRAKFRAGELSWVRVAEQTEAAYEMASRCG